MDEIIKINQTSIILLAIILPTIAATMTINNDNITGTDYINSISIDNLDLNDFIGFSDTQTYHTLVYYGKDIQAKEKMILDVLDEGGVIIENFQNIPGMVFKIPVQKAVEFESIPGMIRNEAFQMFESASAMIEIDGSELESLSSLAAEYQKLIDVASGSGLWDDNYKGEGVKIAIMDTGIDSNHSDLEVAPSNAFSFVTTTYGFTEDEDISDGHGHGTHVAGIAAGKGTSDERFTGLAPEATLVNLKVASMYGNSYPAAVMAAVDKAIELDVDIISLSLGFSQDIDHPLSLRLDEVVDTGIIVVASAGNSGPSTYTANIPGASRKTITVGSSNFNKAISDFSSRGPANDERMEPDIIAPGENVFSALAYGSLMDFAVESLVEPPNYVSGGSTRNDYIAMSGTSMSAPFIAGAVALLKDKFPTATPAAIRAALMEGADEINGEEYETGSGFVNLAAASSVLETHHVTQGYNNYIVFPVQDLLPWDVNLFPGDEYTVRPTVLSGIPADFQFSVDGSMNGSDFLELNETAASDIEYIDFSVTISIPLNASPGTYTGKLIVENTDNGTSKSVLLGPINVILPQKTIYFDIFHSSSFDDSILVNYYSFFQLLSAEGYQIDEYNTPLSHTVLSYDLVIIPDPEITFSSHEIDIIHEYIDNGGNLLVLGSFSPFSIIPGLNQLTGAYGIHWDESMLANTTDIGIDTAILPLNSVITAASPSLPFFDGLNGDLLWYAGTSLSVSDGAVIAATSNGEEVYAYFDGNTTSKGKIFSSGQELQFYNSYLEENSNDIFVTNVINWLSGKNTGNNYAIRTTNPGKTLAVNSTITAGIYVTSDSGLPVTINEDAVNISWILPNGTVSGIYHPIEVDTGIYLHDFNLTNLSGEYTAIIETMDGIKRCSVIIDEEDSLRIEELTLVDSISVQKNTPTWLDDYEILLLDRSISRLFASASIDNSTDLVHATIVINTVPEFMFDLTQTFSESPLYSLEGELAYNAGTGTWQFSWTFDSSMPSGFYVAFIQIIDNHNNTATDYGSFLIINEEPVINFQQSKVGDVALEEYEDPMEYYGSFSHSSTVSVSLVASDSDSPGNISCYYLVLNVPVYIGYQIIVEAGKLSRDNSGVYGVNIKLPSSQPVVSGPYAVKTTSDQVYAIMLIARDSEGNYEISTAYFMLRSGLVNIISENLLEIGLWLLVFIVPPIAILYYFAIIKPRKSKRMTYDEYLFQKQLQSRGKESEQAKYQQRMPPTQQGRYSPPWQNGMGRDVPPIRPKFCGYCGSPIVDPKQKYCMNCGKDLDFME